MEGKLIVCQLTMDVMGNRRKDFIEEIEVGGRVTLLAFANGVHTTLLFRCE
ncbi:MAG: hypothetical protein NVS9B9_31830 [Ktedonobacteraceae bacterium]